MKKYLCILLAFALVLTLAACGGDPSSDLPDPDVEDTGEVSDGATPTDLDAPTAEPTPTNIMTHRIISAAQIRPAPTMTSPVGG